MRIPPVSRRQFIATGSALLASTWVPDWADAFQPGAADDGRRAEVAEAALARARRARRVVRRHPHQPLPPRIDRHARAAGPERVALDQLRPRPARAGQRRVGLRRDQPRRARQPRAPPRNRRSRSPRANAVLATRKVVLANADKVVTTWTSAVQARSVRRAARNQDRVPDEAERDGAGRAGRQLRQLAGAVRRRAEVLRLERRARASRSGWCAPIRSSAPPPPIAPAATSRPAPSSIARSWSATNTSRTIRGCRTPKRPATRWSRS